MSQAQKKDKKSKSQDDSGSETNDTEAPAIKTNSFTKSSPIFETLYKSNEAASTTEPPKSKADEESLETGSADVVSGSSSDSQPKADSPPEADRDLRSAMKSQTSAQIKSGSKDLRSAMKSKSSTPISAGSTDLRSGLKSKSSSPISAGSTDLKSKSMKSATKSQMQGPKSSGSTLKSGAKSAKSVSAETSDDEDVRSGMTGSSPSLALEDQPGGQRQQYDIATEETTTTIMNNRGSSTKSFTSSPPNTNLASQTQSLLAAGPRSGHGIEQIAVLVTGHDAKSRRFVERLQHADAPMILGLVAFDHQSQASPQQQWLQAFNSGRVLPFTVPDEHPLGIDNNGQIHSAANIHLGPPLQALATTSDGVMAPTSSSSYSSTSQDASGGRQGGKKRKNKNRKNARRTGSKRGRNN
jgi:hypothetical protein